MSDERVRIRPFQPEDQPQIEWLYSRTPPAGQVAWRPQSLPEDLRTITAMYAQFFVAVEALPEKEVIVGMIGVEKVGANDTTPPIPPSIRLLARTGRLRHVAVAPERWRTGIGKKLVLTALNWCSEHDYEAVILDTTPQQEPAVQLYFATGFVEVGRSKIGPYDLIWFWQNLPRA